MDDEVFDTTIEGHDESEDIDQDEYGSTSHGISSDRYSMVLEVSPDEESPSRVIRTSGSACCTSACTT